MNEDLEVEDVLRLVRRAKREFIKRRGLTPEQADPVVVVNTEPTWHGVPEQEEQKS